MRLPWPFSPAAALAAVLLAGCAPAATEPAPGPAPAAENEPTVPPGAVSWTVTTRPTLDLWYHGLAYTGFGATPDVPLYQPDYVTRVVAAKRAAGVFPTVLDRRAEEFGRRFAADDRFSVLHFLPLYFDSDEQLFGALQAWIRAEGDPRRVADPRLGAAVQFLSQQIPTQEGRRTVADWLEVLGEEDRAFFATHRRARGAELAGVPAAVQAQWDRLAARLQPALDYLLLNQGEVILSLPIGSEGRTLQVGPRRHRVAIGMPDPTRPADAVWSLLHEQMYALVSGVIEDQLAPAQRREQDEQLLSRRAAVRAGALLLDRLAPEAAADYRAAYLRWAGVTVPAARAERDRAFVQAYPVPEPLPRALAERIDAILEGI